MTTNLYCSEQDHWEGVLNSNETSLFVVGEFQTYSVRDAALYGVCSRGVIAWIQSNHTDLNPIADADCRFTAWGVPNCHSPNAIEIVSREFLSAVRSGDGLQTMFCKDRASFTTILCNTYYEKQALCVRIANRRVQVSRIIGSIGLILYIPLFWRYIFSTFSLLVPIIWSCFAQFYNVSPACIRYTLTAFPRYIIGVCGSLFVLQLVLLISALTQTSFSNLERYVRAKTKGKDFIDEVDDNNSRPGIDSDEDDLLHSMDDFN